MTDSAQDNDTSLALTQAAMLPKDVIDHAEEGSEEIWDLLMMQQVQVNILASRAFQFAFRALGTYHFPYFCFVEPSERCVHLGPYEAEDSE